MLVLFLAILATVGYLLHRIMAESYVWHPMFVDSIIPLDGKSGTEQHCCPTCGRMGELTWQYCPGCGTEMKKQDTPAGRGL